MDKIVDNMNKRNNSKLSFITLNQFSHLKLKCSSKQLLADIVNNVRASRTDIHYKTSEQCPAVFREAIKESAVDKDDYFLKAVRNPTVIVEDEATTASNGNTLYKSIAQYAESKECEKCRGLIMKEGEKDVDYTELPTYVSAVLHKLKDSIKRRRGNKTREKLDEILARVSCALQNDEIGDVFNSSTSLDSLDATNRNEFPGFKPKKISKREVTNELLSHTEMLSETKREIMIELDSWFETMKSEWAQVCSTKVATPSIDRGKLKTLDLISKFEESTNRLRSLIQEELKTVIKTVPTVNETLLNNRPNNIESASDVDVSMSDASDSDTDDYAVSLEKQIAHVKKGNEKFDCDLLSSPDKTAIEIFEPIKRSLMVGKRLTKALGKVTKKTLKDQPFSAAKKNLELITSAYEKKDQKIQELAKDVSDYSNKMDSMNFENEGKLKKASVEKRKLEEENEELQNKIMDLETTIEELKAMPPEIIHVIPKIDSENTESETDVEEVEPVEETDLTKTLVVHEVEIDAPSPVVSKSVIPYEKLEELKTMEVKILEASEKNKELQQENTVLTNRIQEQDGVIEHVEKEHATKVEELQILQKQIHKQTSRNAQLSIEKDDLERKVKNLEDKLLQSLALDSIEEIVTQIEDEQHVTTPVPRETVPNKNQKREAKKKNTIDKTLHRQALAILKKQWDLEVKHLRTFIINEQSRFQANLRKVHLENEKTVNNLRVDNSRIVKALYRFRASVSTWLYGADKTKTDCSTEKEEELRNELSLYEKGETDALSETAMEVLLRLERNLEVMLLSNQLKVKEANANKAFAERDLAKQQESLCKVQQDLNKQSEMMKTVCEEQSLLTDEYKKVLIVNDGLQKDYENAKRSKEKRDDRVQSKNVDENKLSGPAMKNVTTCKESQNLIDTLFEAKRLSETDYDIAKSTIQHSSEISNKQLACLIKRYVNFRKILELKEKVYVIKKQYKDKKRFTNYFTKAENRYRNSMQNLELQNIQLRKKRESIFLSLGDLFFKSNSNFLSIVPLSQTAVNQKACIMGMNETRNIKRSVTKINRTNFDDVIGKRFNPQDETLNSLWQMPPNLPKKVNITTPKILEMDMNPWRKIINGGTLRLPSIATVYP